jgi:hypothetical protein
MVMSNVPSGCEEMLERAHHCELLADKAHDPVLAESFRKLAEQWRRSAEVHQRNDLLLAEEADLLSKNA